MSPQDTVYSGITVTQTKKVKRARAQFPSKHCAMMCLMRIGTLIFGLFLLPLKHAHLPTSPQDLKKHYAMGPPFAQALWRASFWPMGPATRKCSSTLGPRSTKDQKDSFWRWSSAKVANSSQQLQTAEIFWSGAPWQTVSNCHRSRRRWKPKFDFPVKCFILSRSTPSFGCSVERTQKTFQTSAANEWLRRLSCRRGDMAHSCVLNAVCSNNTSKAAVNHSSCPVQSISAPKCLLDMRIFKIDKSERLYW